jgi:hypothetical protein
VSVPEHVTLAREAQGAGLIVTFLMPATFPDRFHVQLWEPGGTVWAEGAGESAAMIRARIAHWPAHRQAVADRGGLRLVGSGLVLACGCPANTTTTTTTTEETS